MSTNIPARTISYFPYHGSDTTGHLKLLHESAASCLSSPLVHFSYRPIALLWASVPLCAVRATHFRVCLFDFVFFQVSYLNSFDFLFWRNSDNLKHRSINPQLRDILKLRRLDISLIGPGLRLRQERLNVFIGNQRPIRCLIKTF